MLPPVPRQSTRVAGEGRAPLPGELIRFPGLWLGEPGCVIAVSLESPNQGIQGPRTHLNEQHSHIRFLHRSHKGTDLPRLGSSSAGERQHAGAAKIRSWGQVPACSKTTTIAADAFALHNISHAAHSRIWEMNGWPYAASNTCSKTYIICPLS